MKLSVGGKPSRGVNSQTVSQVQAFGRRHGVLMCVVNQMRERGFLAWTRRNMSLRFGDAGELGGSLLWKGKERKVGTSVSETRNASNATEPSCRLGLKLPSLFLWHYISTFA